MAPDSNPELGRDRRFGNNIRKHGWGQSRGYIEKQFDVAACPQGRKIIGDISMSENLEQELKEMLVERLFLKIAPEDIENDKNLMTDYGIDSVSVMEMAVGMEELYGVTFDDGEFHLKHFESIDSMAAFVRSKQE